MKPQSAVRRNDPEHPKSRFAALAFFSLGSLLVVSATGRTQAPAPRTQFVYHVYVDPLFGDDLLARDWNPGSPGRLPPLSRHPDTTSSTPQAISGLLHHAPYSFKTISVGALNYVRSISLLCRGRTRPPVRRSST